MQAALLDFCRRETEVIDATVRAPVVSSRLASQLAQRCFGLPTLIEDAWNDVFDELDSLLAVSGDAAVGVIGDETMRVLASALDAVGKVTELVARHQLFDEGQRLEETAAKLRTMRDSFARQWPWPQTQGQMAETAWAAYQRGECSNVEEFIRELRASGTP